VASQLELANCEGGREKGKEEGREEGKRKKEKGKI
jgi:hypothetical protein